MAIQTLGVNIQQVTKMMAEVTGLVARLDLQRGRFHGAPGLRLGTAGVEMASRRGRDR